MFGGDKSKNNCLQYLFCLFNEINIEIRSRRIAEYTYTAASIGAFGGMAWGTAALAGMGKPIDSVMIATIVAIFFMTISVSLKILDENEKYFNLRREAIKICEMLRKQVACEYLPEMCRVPKEAGVGHIYSCMILSVAASGTIYFCISLALTVGPEHHVVMETMWCNALVILTFFFLNLVYLSYLLCRNARTAKKYVEGNSEELCKSK